MSDARAAGPPLLEVKGVVKTFPGVTALAGVDFELRSGEIHALLGENGAGKSTLMKILSGVYKPDGGSVAVKGRRVSHFSPHHARQHGIATVFQELSLALNLTVEENLLLGREPAGFAGAIAFGRRRATAQKYLDLIGANVPLDVRVGSLGTAQQQMVEIAKALSLEPDILIMDEPTAKLAVNEAESVFRLMKLLRDQGKGIIWITHRLEELPRLVDRITVFRDGSYVDSLPIEECPPDRIIQLMVGRELTDMFNRTPHQAGAALLRTEDLALGNRLSEINLTLREGEIVGLVGLVGAGRSLLGKVLSGAVRATGGRVFVGSRPVRITDPVVATRLGIAFIPEDRRTQGLVQCLSVQDNVVLASLQRFTVNRKALAATAEKYVNQLQIRTPSIHARVSQLSGGNQQKVIIAKWLNTGARIFIFDEPTAGIDVGAKAQIYVLLDELARQGAAVLLISSDMKEVLGLSDRVIVMRKGRLTGEFQRDEATQEAILRRALTG